MKDENKKYYFINSLAKGLSVMELLAEKKELTVTGIAHELGLNRAGSHRFLATLKDLGYVEKNENGRYYLTFKLLELGTKAANWFEIRRIARPFMHELSKATKETINLGYFNGTDILHVEKIDSTEVLRIDAAVGSHAPAYCTALGKAVLAHLPKDRLSDYLKKNQLKPMGPNTILSKKELRRELTRIQETGSAVDDEELARGLRCVAAPVFDHKGEVAYALSISGPSLRMPAELIGQMQPLLKDICTRLSKKLGNSS